MTIRTKKTIVFVILFTLFAFLLHLFLEFTENRQLNPSKIVGFEFRSFFEKKVLIETEDNMNIQLSSERVFTVDIDGTEYISERNKEGKYYVSLTDVRIREIVPYGKSVDVRLDSNSDILVKIPIQPTIYFSLFLAASLWCSNLLLVLCGMLKIFKIV